MTPDTPQSDRRPDTLLTVKEAAAELRVSAALVYGLCAVGQMTHERHGRRRGTIRISRAALEEYRRTRTVGAATVPRTPAPAAATTFRHLRL